jgi:hypothetical protein
VVCGGGSAWLTADLWHPAGAAAARSSKIVPTAHQ